MNWLSSWFYCSSGVLCVPVISFGDLTLKIIFFSYTSKMSLNVESYSSYTSSNYEETNGMSWYIIELCYSGTSGRWNLYVRSKPKCYHTYTDHQSTLYNVHIYFLNDERRHKVSSRKYFYWISCTSKHDMFFLQQKPELLRVKGWCWGAVTKWVFLRYRIS